jgi:hypothetical protein
MIRPRVRTTRLRTLLVLAAFAVLLAYVLLVEARRGPSTDLEATPTPWPVLSWEIDDLQTIHVTDGQRTMRLEREGEGWRIYRPAQPGSDPADPRTVYFPLHELATLEARLMVTAEMSDPATYGLDTPALTVTVETRSGEQERLHVGRQTPDTTAFYVQREGDPRLYVVDHYRFESFFEWLSDPPYRATPTPEIQAG